MGSNVVVVRDRAPYSGTAGLGIFLLGLAPLIYVVAGMLAGFEFSPFIMIFTIVGVVLLIVSLLAWRAGAWAKVLGILAILGGGYFTWFQVFGLFEPRAAIEFTAGAAWIVGALVGLIGCLAALVKGRDAVGGGNGGGLNAIAVVLVLVAAGASGFLNYSAIEDLDAGDSETVRTVDFVFEPDEVTVEAGEVTFVVDNDDPFTHTFTLDASETYDDDQYDVNRKLLPLTDARITFDTPDEAGSYVVFCIPHSTPDDGFDASADMPDMFFVLTVE